MTKEELKIEIDKGFSIRKIAKSRKVSYSTINYWIKKYDIKLLSLVYKCKCGENNPDKFYGHKISICSKCQNQYNIKKANERKALGVKYLGGKCSKCNYNKFQGALDFHHVDPTTKDKNFKNAKYWNVDKYKKELDKCILLCRNCHAEEHYMLI